jgi:hypothetical protein
MRFEFSSTNDDWPFRLLLVDSLNPPAPLAFGKGFIQSDRLTASAALQSSLAERLLFHLVGGQVWRLRPFVASNDRKATNYLYDGWPPEDVPESELDFASARQRALQRQESMQAGLAGMEQSLALMKKGIPDFPLGAIMGLDNDRLATFTGYPETGLPSKRFIKYLVEVRSNALPRQPWVSDWPHWRDQDGPNDFKFQLLFASLTNNLPGALHQLFADDPNYLPALWRSLKGLDEASQKAARAKKTLVQAQERLAVIPADLEETAWVGLFIADPGQPRLGVEMARFQRR